MPELPEVESVARSLWDGVPSLQGKRVCSVSVLSTTVVAQPEPDVFKSILHKTVFKSLYRIGKYLIFEVESSSGTVSCLIVHLRMTGRLSLVPTSEAGGRFTRLIIYLDSGLALRFDDPRKFGRAWVVDDPKEIVGRLGPDALTIGSDQFVQRLLRTHRQLKPLLLDQSFVAGIGNIYADEILHRCRLHPLRSSARLTTTEMMALHSAMHSVLTEAVAANGANIDGVFKAGSFPVAVYGRGGFPCMRCGTTIEKTRIGQRGTSFCPVCQPVAYI